tara:strand:+ start:1541 stop:1651 length:111 start_codon:yes stop_codon:yes gene_type:complete
MFVGKTTFVVVGVNGVSDVEMGGMYSSNDKDGTVFH